MIKLDSDEGGVFVKGACKVQQMGVEKDGTPRYFLYACRAIRMLGLSKGEKVFFELRSSEKNVVEMPEKVREGFVGSDRAFQESDVDNVVLNTENEEIGLLREAVEAGIEPEPSWEHLI